MSDHTLAHRTLYQPVSCGLLGKFILVALASLPEETGTVTLLARLSEQPHPDVIEALECLLAAERVTCFEYEGETRYRMRLDTDQEMTFARLKDRLWKTMEENPETPYFTFLQMARDATVKYAGLKGLGTGVKLEDVVISHALGAYLPHRFASSEGAWKSHQRWWALRKAYGTEQTLRAIKFVATSGNPDKGDPLNLATWALKDIVNNPGGRTASKFTEMRTV